MNYYEDDTLPFGDKLMRTEFIVIDGEKFRVNDVDCSGIDVGFLINGRIWFFVESFRDKFKTNGELGEVSAYTVDNDTYEMVNYPALNVTLIPYNIEVMTEGEYRKKKAEDDRLDDLLSEGWQMLENGELREAKDGDDPQYMFWEEVPRYVEGHIPNRIGFNVLEELVEYIRDNDTEAISVSAEDDSFCSYVMSFWNEKENGKARYKSKYHDKRVKKYNTWWVEGYVKDIKSNRKAKFFKEWKKERPKNKPQEDKALEMYEKNTRDGWKYR